MHIILGFLAILGGAAFWWWRLKMLSQATSEISDVAGRAVGKYKRYKFRKKVEDSPLEAVDDPVAAAVIMMYAIAQDAGPATPVVEKAIKSEVMKSMGVEDPTEVMVFAKWVASHVADPNNVSLRYGKLWIAALSQPERQEFLDMVERVAASTGPINTAQQSILGKLRERLALLH
jgi:hypothetical protein